MWEKTPPAWRAEDRALITGFRWTVSLNLSFLILQNKKESDMKVMIVSLFVGVLGLTACGSSSDNDQLVEKELRTWDEMTDESQDLVCDTYAAIWKGNESTLAPILSQETGDPVEVILAKFIVMEDKC